jgi:hypothetical protein
MGGIFWPVMTVALAACACTGSLRSGEQQQHGPDAGPAGGKADEPDPTPGEEPIWSPAPGVRWQWQLTGAFDPDVDAEVFDVDLFETPDQVFADLVAADRRIICYFSAGSYEGWRPDADRFPGEALGEILDGWPDERWLDIRHPAIREIMADRLDHAAARGCDAVEPDNVDGYANASGFPLSYDDQLAFNRFLAAEAHARGLSIGLKNDLDQVADLVDHFDWALNEECMQYDECEALVPFIEAGKAVLHVEYGDSAMEAEVCPRARELGFDTLIKRLDLDAWRLSCR